MALEIIILAAGQGTRMRSRLPKVLHRLAGRPLLEHVIDSACALDANRIHVIHGHGGEAVREQLGHCPVNWVEQSEQLGTGHAVAQALPHIADDANVLVLYGDVPLIRTETMHRLVAQAGEQGMGLLTARLDDPSGYGRILRNDAGIVTGIVEQKDASTEQLAIDEINTGFMAANARQLKQWIEQLDNNNAQNEYYLTDVIALASRQGIAINAIQPDDVDEILGINDRAQLACLERRFQSRIARDLLLQGVTLIDPARIDVRGTLQTGQDVEIDVNAVFEGKVSLGDNVVIGANCFIRNAEIGAGTVLQPNCHIENAVIGREARIGPFSRIRPETRLADRTHVGNFVEIKKSDVGEGSKINHLSYVGDSSVGSGVNIGAGTITCNYDGANKHRTVIGNNAFIGSDTQLVAPVTVGDGATIGAGSTITRDAPPGELTLSRAPQKTHAGWQRPTKTK